MSHKIKVIETGVDSQGVSKITHERVEHDIQPMETIPSFRINNTYYVEDLPIDYGQTHLNKPYDINLPPKSLRFLRCSIPPYQTVIRELNDPKIQTLDAYKDAFMHRTDSVDYFYIVSGKVTMLLDNGDKCDLQQGDFFAMRGAMHVWINEGPDNCDLVGVMLGAAAREDTKGFAQEL